MTGIRSVWRCCAALIGLGAVLPFPASAQSKSVIERERREFAEWLRTAPISPWRAIVVQPIGPGITVGPPSATIPLAGVEAGRLSERDGRISLRVGQQVIPAIRGRPVLLGSWTLVVSGRPGRATATVYGAAPAKPKPPVHFPYDPQSVHVVTLEPAAAPRTQPLLAPDGVEVEAGDAGTVTVPLGTARAVLRVMRLPGATEDESELEIFFRDATSGRGTYPAGRFVALIPQSGGRYLLDFNRARNPFCAYNTVYPCPAQWRGNALTAAIKAGERYAGGGLDAPPQ